MSAQRRIVVTFGTQRRFGFERAARRLAALLPAVAAPDAEVLWQTGATDLTGTGISGRAHVPPTELAAAIATADLVIAHAGVGSALAALDAGRCPVLLPRLRRHGEHTDDHQLQIATDLHRRQLAIARAPDALTAADLHAAAAMRIRRPRWPTPFTLQDDLY
jgi:UDP-N-acetylglucosamine--N-acetylmuramyl-(pentapeptide) pyrophosphoryl-undecaprenol N-acetylglucosamine transferase